MNLFFFFFGSYLYFPQEMRSCIETFGRRPEHRTVHSCVVCLLSHGEEGAVYGTDGELLQVRRHLVRRS